jgi:hypothetical protein
VTLEAEVVPVLNPEELRESEAHGQEGTFYFIESRGGGPMAGVGGDV